MGNTSRQTQRINLLEDLGHPIAPGARILDLGCGNGGNVQSFLSLGFDAHGCDLKFKPGEHLEALRSAGRIKELKLSPYRIPFDDDAFNLVVTEQVFEHVQDYPSTLAEIKRVLKPGGVSLNVFPTRLSPLEPHVHIPFASVLQSYPWISLWVHLGIRQAGCESLPPKEAARVEHEYLKSSTNYLTTAEIRRHGDAVFGDTRFVELEALKHSSIKQLYPLCTYIPACRWLLSTFVARVVLFTK